MTRWLSLAALLALSVPLLGCCYQAGGYDPCTGMMWGGGL